VRVKRKQVWEKKISRSEGDKRWKRKWSILRGQRCFEILGFPIEVPFFLMICAFPFISYCVMIWYCTHMQTAITL
jgi:hypothetical protein